MFIFVYICLYLFIFVYVCLYLFMFDSIVCTVATGVTNFPGDLFLVPRAVASFKFSNLLSFNFADRGGHFAAFEEPQLLAEELVNFIRMAESKH